MLIYLYRFENPNAAAKKSKKSAMKTSVSSNPATDQIALNRRAARFEREHEIERQKQQPISYNQNSSSTSSNWSNSRLYASTSHPAALMGAQQEVGDPVWGYPYPIRTY